jgi:hypothetical protein
METAHLITAERSARDHPFDGLFEDALGKAAFEHLARSHTLDATRKAGVLVVDLLVELAPGEADLVGVDDDHVVAAVNVRREAWLVLPPKHVGDDRRHSANNQPIGVDQMPFLVNFRRLCRLRRFHQRLHGLNLSL